MILISKPFTRSELKDLLREAAVGARRESWFCFPKEIDHEKF